MYGKTYILRRYIPSSALTSALEYSAVSHTAVSVMVVHSRNRKDGLMLSHST